MRFLSVAAAPLGALLAGILADAIGLRPIILLTGAGGVLLCIAATRYSPLQQLKHLTAVAPPAAGVAPTGA
jgi:MFS family permease